MKKNAFFLLLCLGLITIDQAAAQVEKGKFMVGARSDFSAFFNNTTLETTLNGNTTEEDGTQSNEFGLTPTVGYFIAEGFAGGLFLDWNMSATNRDQVLEDGTTENLKYNSNAYQIGPFVRYYLDMDKVKPFAHVQAGFGASNLTYDVVEYDFSDPLNPKIVIEEDERKTGLSSWSIGAGAAFFITGNIAVDVMLGYNSQTRKYNHDETDFEEITRTSGFGLDVGFTIVIP